MATLSVVWRVRSVMRSAWNIRRSSSSSAMSPRKAAESRRWGQVMGALEGDSSAQIISHADSLGSLPRRGPGLPAALRPDFQSS